jgi:hypothetical protein
VKFCAWGVAVELDDEPKSIRSLIERLRELGESPRPRDHLYAVVVDAALTDRLDGLSDRQIGQLLFDVCWAECYVASPEASIVTQAIDRLRRSTGGVITKEEAQDDPKHRPVCPECGSDEMFLYYGIDEPDFWRCDYGSCQHKIYVGEH